jgi:hypothetical protein
MTTACIDEPEGAENQISPAGEDFEIEGVELTPVSAIVRGELSATQIGDAIERVARRERGVRWWLGDLLAFSEDREHGVTYPQWAERTGLARETLYNRAALARAVPPRVRLPEDELSWAKHRPVEVIKDEERQEMWLARAADENWSEEKLRDEIDKAGEGQKGKGGHGAFASRGGDQEPGSEFESLLDQEVPCPRCKGKGKIPAAEAVGE